MGGFIYFVYFTFALIFEYPAVLKVDFFEQGIWRGEEQNRANQRECSQVATADQKHIPPR